jgi:hypothetical protein
MYNFEQFFSIFHSAIGIDKYILNLNKHVKQAFCNEAKVYFLTGYLVGVTEVRICDQSDFTVGFLEKDNTNLLLP